MENDPHQLHCDHLGTPCVITTASGGTSVIEGRQNYGPYGETFPAMDSGYQPLTGYTGHLQTDPTGLIYMRGRFYTPIWHRFVNSDQGADPSTWNQMAYVGGSPMQATDPSGRIQVIIKCGGVIKESGDFDSIEDAQAEAAMVCGGSATVAVTGSSDDGPWTPSSPSLPGVPDRPEGGGGPPAILNNSKCKLIREMLAYEATHGTWATGRNFSNTWPGGDNGVVSSAVFTNPYPYKNETPTQYGPVDMDWYLTIAAFSGPTVLAPTKGAYFAGKLAWEGISAATAIFNRGNYSEGQYHPEWPYQDPGEANAANLFEGGKTLHDLFPKSWMDKNCPEGK